MLTVGAGHAIDVVLAAYDVITGPVDVVVAVALVVAVACWWSRARR